MTPTPPQSALTNEQIIERLAVEIMGWEIASCKKIGRSAFVTGMNDDMLKKYSCFCQIPFSTGFAVHGYVGEWNPLTDADHASQVVEKMRSSGHVSVGAQLPDGAYHGFPLEEAYLDRLNGWRFPAGFADALKNRPDLPIGFSADGDMKRAICFAALLALDSLKND